MSKRNNANALIQQTFEWTGLDRTGQTAKGDIQAYGETQAAVLLRRNGIVKITSLKLQENAALKGVRPRQIAAFTRQFATMIKAGVPLLQCLEITSQGQDSSNLTKLIGMLRADIESGVSLTNAFRKHPLQFDDLYCNLLQAGERSGELHTMLDRLATHMEKSAELKRKVRAALIYPTILLVATVLAVAAIMTWVVPSFQTAFTNMGSALPWPTQALIAVSDFWLHHGIEIAALLGILVFAVGRVFQRRGAQRLSLDRRLLALPYAGLTLQKISLARWTRTLATVFNSGVPISEALLTAADACGNSVYAMATREVQEKVASGAGLAYSMRSAQVFPPLLLQMTQVGEETGMLEEMLNRVADFYDNDVNDAVARFSKVLEPVLFLFMGLIIAGLMLALYMPMFNLGQQVG